MAALSPAPFAGVFPESAARSVRVFGLEAGVALPALVDAVCQAMREGLNQYPPMAGVPPLRDAVSAKIEALYGKRYDAGSEITITAGATPSVWLDDKPVFTGDLAAALEAVKSETRYVVVNADQAVPHGMVQRVQNAVLAAGCELAMGTQIAP